MNIQNVLVPVDFSTASRFAVNCGVSFARKFRARLTLLHVREFPSAMAYAFPANGEKAVKQRYDKALERMTSLLGPEDQDDLDLQIRIREGEVDHEIRAAIVDEHASLVVMGTHSRGIVERVLIGSVTHDLLRKIPVPVVTVSHDAQTLKFSRILFASSLTESFHEEFEPVLHFARKMAAELVVFHSMTGEGGEAGGRLRDAQDKLAVLEAECGQYGVKVRTELTAGPVAERLFEVAKAAAAELVVLTVQHKGLVERALLGSTAEGIVRDSNVPVLSIPVRFEKTQTLVPERERLQGLEHSELLFD